LLFTTCANLKECRKLFYSLILIPKLDRVVSISYNGIVKYSCVYNNNGDICKVNDNFGTTAYEYEYVYDSLDRPIVKYVKTGGAVVQESKYTYDEYGRAKEFDYSITGLGSRHSANGYNDDGSLSRFASANGDVIDFSYDKLDRLNTKTVEHDGTVPDYVYTYTYKDLSTTQTINLIESVGTVFRGESFLLMKEMEYSR